MAKTKVRSTTTKTSNRQVQCWSFFMTGLGTGILLTNPVVNPHPLRWGVLLVLMGVAIYLMSGSRD